MISKKIGLFSGFYFLAFAAMSVISVVLPIFLNDVGLNKGTIGFVMAAGPLAAMVAPPLWGYAADHTRAKKHIILLCLSGAMVASLCFNLFPVVTVLFGVYFLYNFFQSSIGPLSDSLVLSSLESNWYGKIRLWGSIGFALGALLCGKVLEYFPSRDLFVLYFLFGCCALAVGYLLPKEKYHPDWNGIHLGEVLDLTRNREFLVFLTVIVLVMVPYGAYCSFLGLYLKELGGTPLQIGLAWTIAALAEVPFFAWGARWVRPNNAWQLLGLGALIFGLRWLTYGIWGNPVLILVLQLIQCFTFGLFFLVAVQLVNWLTPNSLKAIGQTVFASVSFGLSFVIGNLLGGALALLWGLNVLFICAGIMAFCGGILGLLASRLKPKV